MRSLDLLSDWTELIIPMGRGGGAAYRRPKTARMRVDGGSQARQYRSIRHVSADVRAKIRAKNSPRRGVDRQGPTEDIFPRGDEDDDTTLSAAPAATTRRTPVP